MNSNREREKNPRQHASIFSIVTFSFTFPLFRKSWEQDINDNDIYEVLPSFASKKLGDTLENNWNLQKNKVGQPSLYKALFDCFAKRYLILGAIHLVVKIIFIFVQPLAMSKVVAYFQPNQTKISRSDLYLHAGLMISLNILGIIYYENYCQFVIEEGIKMRTALTTLIYRKVLRLGTHHSTNDVMGKVVTLITKDVMAFEQLVVYLNDMWIYFIETIVVCCLIYSTMGYSVVVSIGFLLAMFWLQCYLGKKYSSMRIKSARCTDNRLQITKQALSAMNMIKIHSRENLFEKEMNVLRRKELNYLAAICYIQSGILVISLFSTMISFFLFIMIYIWTGNFMDAETLYYTHDCFSWVKQYFLNVIPNVIAKSSEVHASLERITLFLNTVEVAVRPATSTQPRVFLDHIYVEMEGTHILEDVSLSAEKGLYLVTGKVASGKTVLLKTILSEYTTKTGQIEVSGSISYSSENCWLFPSTIRQNILFGQKYNKTRYKKVCSVCLLDQDFSRFEKGDQTIVGDDGSTLSRGQQTRISLARAVYRESDIYLLDDTLAHLDSHTNMYISKKCLMEFLKDKIVILTTRNLDHVKLVYAQQILLMERGKMHLEQVNDSSSQKITNSLDPFPLNDSDIGETNFEKDYLNIQVNETTQLLESEMEPSSNIYHEGKQQGKVRLAIYQRYYKLSGGPCIFLVMLLCYFVSQITSSYSEILFSQWLDMESNLTRSNMTNSSEHSGILKERNVYLIFYCLLIFVFAALVFLRTYLMLVYSLRASMELHESLAHSILNSLMTFFDRHHIGNIVNRFSKDLSTVDEMIPSIIHEIFKSNVELIGLIVLLVSVNAIFLIPLGILLILLSIILKFYLKTGRSIKRLESSARSPMIGHLNATLESLATVRAFGNQYILIEEFDRHQDHFTSANYLMNSSMRALSLYGALVCSLFMTGVTLNFLFLDEGSTAGDVGLAISQASTLANVLLWSMRQLADLETHMTATERVLEYTDIATENKKGDQIKQNWPNNGKIEFRDVSLTYSLTKHRVLNSMNFIIRPNESIGIVGRSGMGTSSIVSSLLRLHKFEGSIIIDDVDIETVSLHLLRSKISVIPQHPILFSGTVRSELDPKREFSDEAIWNALEAVHMKRIISDLHARFTDEGPHFTCGQKYLICLARAILRKNNIIVLDQPTANVELEICQLIQSTIRIQFSGCTVFVIAHRMDTVLNLDRVMVIGNGKIVEFDSPSVLLENQNGVFYGMVQQEQLSANYSQ